MIMTSSIRFRSVIKFPTQNEEPIDLLAAIGKKIYLDLNAELKEILKGAKSIHLVTNDVTVPWEIMHDGEQFLGLKYPFGISPMIKRQDLEKEPKRNAKLKVLFIVDTKNNLPRTRDEIQKIFSLMTKNVKSNKIEYVFLKGEEATRSHISNLLQKQYFDIIHVATHAKFDPTNSAETGIVLNDGILRTSDIYKTIKDDPPWLVFMNACESAKTRDLSYFEKYDELSGLGIAFVKAGAPSYIGTSGIINDFSASELAVSFYRNLLQGFTVGESLRKAKREFFDNNSEDLSWSAFTLYGDPNLQKDLEEEVSTDKENQVWSYYQDKKKEKGMQFSYAECSRKIGISISEVRRIIHNYKSMKK
jgi:CHAT domain-containing protein